MKKKKKKKKTHNRILREERKKQYLKYCTQDARQVVIARRIYLNVIY